MKSGLYDIMVCFMICFDAKHFMMKNNNNFRRHSKDVNSSENTYKCNKNVSIREFI